MTQLCIIDLLERYPAVPGHRGVSTSIVAAKKIRKVSRKWDAPIIEAFKKYGPLTYWEIERITGLRMKNLQPAISRMVKRKEVVESGIERENPDGNMVAAWRLR